VLVFWPNGRQSEHQLEKLHGLSVIVEGK